MRDTKHLEKHSNTLAANKKEKNLFRNLRREVEAGANGTLDYTIKEGVNKNKIADDKILKSKKWSNSCNTFQTLPGEVCVQNYVFLQTSMQCKHQFDHQ